MQFDIETKSPDHTKIPAEELLSINFTNEGVTAIILSVSYRKQEFFRVGYYVYNHYIDQ
jgi:histone chaperone ASF1